MSMSVESGRVSPDLPPLSDHTSESSSDRECSSEALSQGAQKTDLMWKIGKWDVELKGDMITLTDRLEHNVKYKLEEFGLRIEEGCFRMDRFCAANGFTVEEILGEAKDIGFVDRAWNETRAPILYFEVKWQQQG